MRCLILSQYKYLRTELIWGLWGPDDGMCEFRMCWRQFQIKSNQIKCGFI